MSLGHGARVVSDGLVFCFDAANANCFSGVGHTYFDVVQRLVGAGSNETWVSGAVSFNGANSYIQYPYSSAFNVSSVSVEVWVKTGALSQLGFWFEKGQVNTQYSLFQENYNVIWRQYSTTTQYTTQQSFDARDYLSTSSWAQVVGTFTPGDRRMFVNGGQVRADTETGPIAITTGPECIGQFGTANGYPFSGQIAIVRVYGRNLLPAEVMQNFQANRRRFGV